MARRLRKRNKNAEQHQSVSITRWPNFARFFFFAFAIVTSVFRDGTKSPPLEGTLQLERRVHGWRAFRHDQLSRSRTWNQVIDDSHLWKRASPGGRFFFTFIICFFYAEAVFVLFRVCERCCRKWINKQQAMWDFVQLELHFFYTTGRETVIGLSR